MRRASTQPYPFDAEGFKSLLIKAIGEKNQAEFARESGMSTSYLSKYLNLKMDKPPMNSTLEKIALFSDSRVSIYELQKVAGYISESDYELKTTGKYHSTSYYTNYGRLPIIIENQNRSISNMLRNYDTQLPKAEFDNELKAILTEHNITWIFVFVDSLDIEDTTSWVLIEKFIRFSRLSQSEKIKISLVTSNPERYKENIEKSSIINGLCISHILTNSDGYGILEETYSAKHGLSDNDIESLRI